MISKKKYLSWAKKEKTKPERDREKKGEK